MPKISLTTIFSAVSIAAGLIGLSGCASHDPGPARPDRATQARIDALSASGYRSPEESSLNLAWQSWTVQGEVLQLSLAFPSGSGRGLPLIVYMPGMGETAQAGARWRQAWARAGYAVLSVQPLEADARAWSSELAREADFKGLARDRQQPSQLQARLAGLRAVLDEARLRAAAGDAMWKRVDFNTVGLAGYELGTQAAFDSGLQPKAVLVISPIAQPAASATPTLIVSSRQDSDPTGFINSPSQRSGQAFEQFPAGVDGHYLLMLEGASHAALAGSAGPDLDEQAESRPARAPSQNSQGQGGGGGRKRGGGGGGGGQGGGGGGQGGPRGNAPDAGGRGPSASTMEAAAIIEASSTAFWDASLRGLPQARIWLQQGAGDWMRGLAVLDRR